MDVGLHQSAKCRINLPMARYRSGPAKCGADDPQREMSSSIARTGMTDVLVALVDQFDFGWRQDCECGADARCARFAIANCSFNHGKIRRNGRTSTLS